MNRTLVFGSSNPGKRQELERLLIAKDIELLPPPAGAMDTVVESGATYVENALIKARAACVTTGLPALADDSGLVVPALQGAPGVHSARYAGSHGNADLNNRKLLQELHKLGTAADRTAHFCCVLVLLRHPLDPEPVIAEGTWDGCIATEPKGTQGFGYDPLFIDAETGDTVAAMSLETKNRLSHRAKAAQMLLERYVDFDLPLPV